MNTETANLPEILDTVTTLLNNEDLEHLAAIMEQLDTMTAARLVERLPLTRQAVVYRLLPKDRAMGVFEIFSPAQQGDLIQGLRAAEVAELFANLDPDDRAWVLDELPAALTSRMLHGLTEKEQQLTSEVLGYPKGSVGRRMSPEYVTTRTTHTVAQTMQRVHENLDHAETIYTLPVLDDTRHVIGVISLRDLLRAEPEQLIGEIMQDPVVETAYTDDEIAARTCADMGLLALPIVDRENRLVGILTLDDAAKILEHEATEDSSRQGGVEPLRRPYLSTPIRRLVTSRIVWLLVLAIGAGLTVQVLSVFEATLAEVTALALFVPLLIGTGGNTGNQAATTVTRAMALGDVELSDLKKVFGREFLVGLSLGLLLGIIGALAVGIIFEPRFGVVIGLTIVAVCTLAATVGGIMPLVARRIGVDPAVFSNPFITTFVDASGLVLYFLIAKAILGV